MAHESRAADQARLAKAKAKGRAKGAAQAAVEPEPPPADVAPPELPDLSLLWREIRETYPDAVREQIERIMRAGKLQIDDLIFLELAEHQMLTLALSDPKLGERVKAQLTSAALQSRKQIARLLVERGPLGGVMDQPVAVPEGMTLPELDAVARKHDTSGAGDTGMDMMARPGDADLPEKYR